MNLLDALLGFLKNNPTPTAGATPEGICPNCWGRDEYGGKFYEAVKNNNTDVNSKNPNIGWVQDYANKHLAGIQLQQQNNELVCQKCKVTYHPE